MTVSIIKKSKTHVSRSKRARHLATATTALPGSQGGIFRLLRCRHFAPPRRRPARCRVDAIGAGGFVRAFSAHFASGADDLAPHRALDDEPAFPGVPFAPSALTSPPASPVAPPPGASFVVDAVYLFGGTASRFKIQDSSPVKIQDSRFKGSQDSRFKIQRQVKIQALPIRFGWCFADIGGRGRGMGGCVR